MRTRAAIIREPGKPWEVTELSLDEPRQGEVRIAGWKVDRLPHALEVGASSTGPVRQNLDAVAYSKEINLLLQPFFILQREGPEDGLARDWPRPDSGVQMHESYALQWYSFAAVAIILGVVFSFRRG